MLVLPIPMITALALGFLFVHAVLKGDRPWLFAALLGACALQGVVVSLAQYYGVAPLRLVQPVTATLVPPLAWVTFQATAVRPFAAARDLPHLAVPALTAFCVAFAPAALDVVVPGVFLVYGAAILLALRPGADVLPLTRLETGDRPGLIWRGIALALILSALGDALIAVAQSTGAGWLQAWIISVSSSLSLGLVGALALSQSLAGGEETVAPVARAPDADGLDARRRTHGALENAHRRGRALSRSGPDAGPIVATAARAGEATFGDDQSCDRRKRLTLCQRIPHPPRVRAPEGRRQRDLRNAEQRLQYEVEFQPGVPARHRASPTAWLAMNGEGRNQYST